jgi:hypothetical protein
VHTGQIALDPIVTPQQKAARQCHFNGDNLIERINLQPLTRERQFAQVGRIAKEHSVFRMGTSMTTTVRHNTPR